MGIVKINKELQTNIIGVHGAKGKAWLENLSAMLQKIESTLGIKLGSPFENLSFNYVAPCILPSGEPAIFKCSVPNKELIIEVAALKYFTGDGCAKLIDFNLDDGWMMIERLYPGKLLAFVEDDEKATRLFISVMQKLHKPINESSQFPTIADWLRGFERLRQEFNGDTGPFPKELICRAEKLSRELLQSSKSNVLLHGDLHHYNILSSQRDNWLAIDPKGVIGEREYEIGAFMKNPMPNLMYFDNLKKVLVRRIEIIVEMTGFDRQRLFAWSFVKAMLTAWWCYESKVNGMEILLPYAKILQELLK